MRRFILLIAILLPCYTMAQELSFDSPMKEYSTKSNCTTINISGVMLQTMGADIGAEFLQAISVEDEALIEHFKKQAATITQGMNVIMSVNADGESVQIFQREYGEGKTEIIILTSDSDGCVLMRIDGKDIEFSNISSLMNI